MRNTYPGLCYRCRKMVKPFDGHFERIALPKGYINKAISKWRLQHAKCAIQYRYTNKGKE
jgi:hypothetical protein